MVAEGHRGDAPPPGVAGELEAVGGGGDAVLELQVPEELDRLHRPAASTLDLVSSLLYQDPPNDLSTASHCSLSGPDAAR